MKLGSYSNFYLFKFDLSNQRRSTYKSAKTSEESNN